MCTFLWYDDWVSFKSVCRNFIYAFCMCYKARVKKKVGQILTSAKMHKSLAYNENISLNQVN